MYRLVSFTRACCVDYISEIFQLRHLDSPDRPGFPAACRSETRVEVSRKVLKIVDVIPRCEFDPPNRIYTLASRFAVKNSPDCPHLAQTRPDTHADYQAEEPSQTKNRHDIYCNQTARRSESGDIGNSADGRDLAHYASDARFDYGCRCNGSGAAGAPRSKPSVLKSSSRSGQCMPYPAPATWSTG